jgi:alkylation response protein AidB-like acyl-CoA dehydrogenase
VSERSFASTDEQAMLEEALSRFVRDSRARSGADDSARSVSAFNPQRWGSLAELGVTALPFKESDGGLGGSLASVMMVAGHLGNGLVREPYLECIVTAGRLLAQAENSRLRSTWLPELISGEKLIGLAHHERGDPARPTVSATRLRRDGAGDYVLAGTKMLVPVPSALQAFLVTARGDGGRLSVCLIPADSNGINIRPYVTVHGQSCGDVTFQEVRLPADSVLTFPDVQSTLEEVMAYACAAACADSAGCMRALMDLTLEHCKTRKQFGQPLGAFQVLKHRLVDCYASLQEVEAILELASSVSSPDWMANVAAAKAFTDEHAIRLGHESIQMHGGMGLTDELAVSHYHKRIVFNSLSLGDRDRHTEDFLRLATLSPPGARSGVLGIEELLTPQEAGFRREVQEFVRTALGEEIRLAVRRQTCTYLEKDLIVQWQHRLAGKGWLAPLWPVEHGGTGWTAVQRFLFEYECAIAGAPERVPMGFRYVGPVIARFGSAWQKSFFLPKMLAGEHYWAQGFSEPGAGSDLAAIKTTAVRDGDSYVVNGTKMWTTHAHFADWVFCIVRTEQTARTQDGISFLLIDLTSPGIRIEPIRLLAVDHEVNQIFFDDVKVPVSNLVGEAGCGWQYAKFLLELERGGSAFSGRVRHELNAVKELMVQRNPQWWQDKVVAFRVAALEYRLLALEVLELRLAKSMSTSQPSAAGGSLTKLLASELQKDVTELGARLAGVSGLEFAQPRPLLAPEALGFPGIDLELVAMPRYLNTRATSIFGGASEIQREIIAKQVLGLR